ncbi:MAG: 6-phosphogluconolactonase [Acidobacteriaceae bacterium]|nr:6-phosphogluconolactonase [Acidobacteriaceae bacterium]MBV9441280.1 6-phosphogluconolactonase [Acidobacteriaceae bacterium]
MDNIRIAEDPTAVAHQCADFAIETLSAAVKANGRASFAISGGHSPKLLFSLLASRPFDWSEVHFFWVDERCVPPDSDESNYKLANLSLLLPAKIPQTNIHRVHGEVTPDEGALLYIESIRTFFGLANHQLPVFDLLHRGMGPDAHTASLFPGEPLIRNETGIAAAVWVEKFKSHRVTLLPGVLKQAGQTVLQVSGSDKADALHNVLKGPEDPLQFPCQIGTRGSNRAVWFLDKAAAAKI